MDIKVLVWLTILIAQSLLPRSSGEPLTAIAVAAAAAAMGVIIYNYDPTCQVSLDISGLKKDLSQKLYGQHIVEKAVINHIKDHFESKDPHRSLVLSFHGPTGVGKNYVSQIIADNLLFKGRDKSPYVYLISATKEFPHESMLPYYKVHLQLKIEQAVRQCDRSVFIFDEVDKLPSSLLDILKPYVDFHRHLDGVSYRNASFIFLSNEGGTEISEIVFDYWRRGIDREELRLSYIENRVMVAAINANNHKGLWHSQLISNHLITAFIPFLPLEKKHVRACIRDGIAEKYRQISQEPKLVFEKYVEEVMQELTFYPAREQVFSVTGCKRIREKIAYVMA